MHPQYPPQGPGGRNPYLPGQYFYLPSSTRPTIPFRNTADKPSPPRKGSPGNRRQQDRRVDIVSALLPTPPTSDFEPLPELLDKNTRQKPCLDGSLVQPTRPKSFLPAAPSCPSISKLTPRTIERLQATTEGTYILRNITPADFLEWQDRYPGLSESDVRYEYDGLSERMVIKCMAGHIHDSMPIFFTRRVGDEVRDAGPACRRQLQIAATTEFTGFAGKYEGLGSRKAPDAYVKVAGTESFPTVVVEVGWSESKDDLFADAKLWLLGTGFVTKVCIIVHFEEEKPSRQLKKEESDNESSESDPDGVPVQSMDATALGNIPTSSNNALRDGSVEDINSELYADELALIAGLDKSSHLNHLSKELLSLHRRQALSEPLLRPFSATLHAYRLSDAHEIYEECAITVLPAPEDGVAQIYELSVKDLYGDEPVPNGCNPDHKIVLDMDEFRLDIADQVPAMEKMRADARALKLLKAKGFVKAGETFSAMKKFKGKRKREYNDEWSEE